MILLELFDSKYPWRWIRQDERSFSATFTDGTDKKILFTAINPNGQAWEIEFSRQGRLSVTGEGDAFKIFSTVTDILSDFIRIVSPDKFFIIAADQIISKDDSDDWGDDGESEDDEDEFILRDGRKKLYRRGLTILAKRFNYDIEELFNGQGTVFLLTKKGIKEGKIINELFDNPYKWNWVEKKEGDYYHVTFENDGRSDIDFYATFHDYTSNWEVIFRRGGSTSTTGQGDAFKIFSTIAEILTAFIKEAKPTNIEITAEKHIISPTETSESRIKLYTRGLTLLSNKLGYTLRTLTSNVDTKFFMRRNRLNESFNNASGNMSPLTHQGSKSWQNEEDFFKKWFSLPYLTNGWADQSVSEDATLKVTDEMIKDKWRRILKKYKIKSSKLKPIVAKGKEIEFEHTKNPQVALNIALDHILEFLDYYDRLEKVEQ